MAVDQRLVAAFDEKADFWFRSTPQKDTPLAIERLLDLLEEALHDAKRFQGGLFKDLRLRWACGYFFSTFFSSLSGFPVSIIMRRTCKALTIPSPVVA